MCKDNLKDFDSLEIEKLNSNTIKNAWAECKNLIDVPEIDLTQVIDWTKVNWSVNPAVFEDIVID